MQTKIKKYNPNAVNCSAVACITIFHSNTQATYSAQRKIKLRNRFKVIIFKSYAK